jgi:hypothetical protein
MIFQLSGANFCAAVMLGARREPAQSLGGNPQVEMIEFCLCLSPPISLI